MKSSAVHGNALAADASTDASARAVVTVKKDATAENSCDNRVVNTGDVCVDTFPPNLRIAKSSVRSSSGSGSSDDGPTEEMEVTREAGSLLRHKRKGVPVKMHVEKKLPAPKVRGRPPKAAYKKEMRKKLRRACRRVVRSSANCVASQGSASDSGGDRPSEERGKAAGQRREEAGSTEEDVKRRGGRARRPLRCSECDHEAGSRAAMAQHAARAHSADDDVTYACCVCDFHTTWNRDYYQHMKLHYAGPPYCCGHDGCSYTADRIQPLLHHRMVHTNERPHACNTCSLRFRTKNNLTTHLRCHTGEKPFKCGVCERSFATKGTLEQHSVTHSDHRPYLCDECGFSTKYQSHLIAHKRIHTGDVFRCEYVGCEYATPKRGQLACHMRSHLSIRSHACGVCGRAFVEKSHLVRHERIHLVEKPFRCAACDYASTRRDKLKEHASKYHGAQADGATVFKPRRPRRQTFAPDAFPGVSQQQAETQIQAHLEAQQGAGEERGGAEEERGRAAPLTLQQQVEVAGGPAAAAAAAAALHSLLFVHSKPLETAVVAGVGGGGYAGGAGGHRLVSMADGRLLSSLQNAAAIGDTAVRTATAIMDMQTGGAATGLMLDVNGIPLMAPHRLPAGMPLIIPHAGYPSLLPPAQATPAPHGPTPTAAAPTDTGLAMAYQHPLVPAQPAQTDFSGLHAFMGIYL